MSLLNLTIVFVLLFYSYQSNTKTINADKDSVLSIAIIGAGQAGLCSAKRALEQEFKVTIFEQNEHIGGIWQYTEETGKNKYGVNIHTAMYKGLR